MVNYGNGKIYKIESTLGDKIYIGSTTKAQLSMRMSKHRSDYKSWKVGKSGMVTSFQLFDEYGLENCSIVLLEDCPCESKDQLLAREAHYIKSLACVNKKIPLRTHKEYQKEYYVDNKEAISVKSKEYRDANKEEIKESQKEYYVDNKEAILAKVKEYREANQEAISVKKKEYRDANKEAMKKYREQNKEAILAKKKEWNEANRDKINEQRRANRAKKKLEQTQ